MASILDNFESALFARLTKELLETPLGTPEWKSLMKSLVRLKKMLAASGKAA